MFVPACHDELIYTTSSVLDARPFLSVLQNRSSSGKVVDYPNDSLLLAARRAMEELGLEEVHFQLYI